ncbi:gas vesicle protein [Streptomyces capparidis]
MPELPELPETRPGTPGGHVLAGRDVALVDLLDRVLAGGVVVTGEVTLCIADVELVRISLHALVASIRAVDGGTPALFPDPPEPWEPRP